MAIQSELIDAEIARILNMTEEVNCEKKFVF